MGLFDWSGASFFGRGGDSGGSNSPTTTEDVTTTEDNRVVAENQGGVLVSPGGLLAEGGDAVNLGAHGTYSPTYEGPVGLDGASVNNLVSSLLGADQHEDSQVSALVSSLQSTLSGQTERMADIVEATKSPEGTDWQKFLPYAILAVFAIFVMRK